jgi:hypothetical protein
MIKSSDVPVTDFKLTQSIVPVRWQPISLISLFTEREREGDRRESCPATAIQHSRSRSSFRIIQLNEDFYVYRSLTDSGMTIEEQLKREWVMRKWQDKSYWRSVTNSFGEWLKEIENRQKDPDLWEELKRSAKFLGDQREQEAENTPFTNDEQAEVSAQMKQVKEYIKTTFELTGEQIEHMDARLDQAEQASRHLGRKDWLLMFNGAVFSLILTDLITPQAAEHIIMLTVHGLGHLFGFGGPPPPLSPGG